MKEKLISWPTKKSLREEEKEKKHNYQYQEFKKENYRSYRH